MVSEVNLNRYRIFCAAAECESISRAAEMLCREIGVEHFGGAQSHHVGGLLIGCRDAVGTLCPSALRMAEQQAQGST